ncbi:MAG: alpha/beta fold hydrolase [Geminocystis sp.]|nr:alpha/beta fold hydrolase [Geminocystis sp.]HIK37600.1 alpha/beta fold hydrolase [Geminocystis sp. M7585_C2015_104]MCS7146597.1 alpha/beta fold hydrolase [Geminocystis sp.]MCX8077504.1 alpha/beta fold hydrolase [Geminocystis sp.]MDW8115423.1 YqiA/YcfP family alpha/beta fold hydrolase [Geminocystis sp.]
MEQLLKRYKHLYLHGFLSGANSAKAGYFRKKYEELGIDLEIADLNLPDFFSLTLTRQIQQVSEIVLSSSQDCVIIGSSFGGLTASWVGERHPGRIKALVLLAPAFNFAENLMRIMTEEKMEKWRREGSYYFYHYGYKKELPLSYNFWEDLMSYDESKLKNDIPTLIFHGTKDEIIPVSCSREYLNKNPKAILRELESDHSLEDKLEEIWGGLLDFYQQNLNES